MQKEKKNCQEAPLLATAALGILEAGLAVHNNYLVLEWLGDQSNYQAVMS